MSFEEAALKISFSILARPQFDWVKHADASTAVRNCRVRCGFAIFRCANDFDQFVFGDRVACFAAENIVESRLGAAFVAETFEVLLRIKDAPSRERIDDDVGFVLRWHLDRPTIPLENAFFDPPHVLNHGHLEVQASIRDRLTNRLAKLRQDHLLHFRDRVGR